MSVLEIVEDFEPHASIYRHRLPESVGIEHRLVKNIGELWGALYCTFDQAPSDGAGSEFAVEKALDGFRVAGDVAPIDENPVDLVLIDSIHYFDKILLGC